MTSLPRLPVLEERVETLEKCVYCPKLCRAACPVSNAEPVETLTPWGKMSMAYFAARGDVPIDLEHAAPAWACTGCFGCRERCDHKNDVASTLNTARAELAARGARPPGATRGIERARAVEAELPAAARALGSDAGASAALLLGCGYLTREPAIARQAKAVAETLLGRTVRVVDKCCGLPSLHAGDEPGFRLSAAALADDVASASDVVVVDPGCARALQIEYGRAGVSIAASRLLLDLAYTNETRLTTIGAQPPRYHDPCQLGRGLGRFEEPRRLLERLAGAPPAEFERARERADCSGAGGMLPFTYPDASRGAARARASEHERLGGGTVVTACASSLRRLRGAGANVEDIVTWLARGLGLGG
jgi:Fe-S oxidoreductase